MRIYLEHLNELFGYECEVKIEVNYLLGTLVYRSGYKRHTSVFNELMNSNKLFFILHLSFFSFSVFHTFCLKFKTALNLLEQLSLFLKE